MLSTFFCTFFLLLNVAVRETKAVQYAPEVTLKSGKIRGLLVDLNTGGTVRKYLGVPFAKAQRFQAPTDPDSWTGVKNMFTIGKICPQRPNPFMQENLSDMTEDCLHLNVFLPHGAGSSLPVMVWIHGGGFLWGSNKIYDGSYIASLGNVIVVAINYRLNVFGFLATGKDGLKGNYGMLDQIHALKWVQNNIKSFGGDPKKVTIFGESAGGASVGFLVLSPKAKGLFQRAIPQSGDAGAIWAYKTYSEALVEAKKMAEANNCSNVESLEECLKTKSFQEIVSASTKLFVGLPFNPVIDGSGGFLPDFPGHLFKNGNFSEVDIMIGYTDDDASVFTDVLPVDIVPAIMVTNGISRSTFIQLAHGFTFVRGQNRVITEAIIYMYTDWINVTNPYTNRRMFLDMANDGMLTGPAVRSANAIAKNISNIYMYQLQHKFDNFLTETIPSWLGSYHGADVVFLFGQSFYQWAQNKSSVFTEGKNFSQTMIQMWTNFAKTGNPNEPERNYSTQVWPKYDLEHQKFMVLKPMFAVQERPRSRHMAFWNEFVPAALKAMPNPTAAPCVDSNAMTLTSGLMMLINSLVVSLYLG